MSIEEPSRRGSTGSSRPSGPQVIPPDDSAGGASLPCGAFFARPKSLLLADGLSLPLRSRSSPASLRFRSPESSTSLHTLPQLANRPGGRTPPPGSMGASGNPFAPRPVGRPGPAGGSHMERDAGREGSECPPFFHSGGTPAARELVLGRRPQVWKPAETPPLSLWEWRTLGDERGQRAGR